MGKEVEGTLMILKAARDLENIQLKAHKEEQR